MNSQHADVCAAIWFASAARDALAAVDIRFHRAVVAGLDVRHAFANGKNLDAEFVAQDARIGKERLFAVKSMDVRAANADAMNAHQRFACFGRCGQISGKDYQFPWLFEADGFHN
jgi:hypothetical protein